MLDDETSIANTSKQHPSESIHWYHQIELPDGTVTAGVNNSRLALSRLPIPPRLDGKSVLDVGAWDGFFSLEVARRGADRVLATDSFVWLDSRFGRAGFDYAMDQFPNLATRIEPRYIDVMELSPEALGETFDLVLFLGVLYHLDDPIGALRRVASVCKGELILETETSLNWLPFPACRVWPGRELADDPTNWFSINRRAIIGLLHLVGFGDIKVIYKTGVLRRVVRALRTPGSIRSGFRSSRIVVRARR